MKDTKIVEVKGINIFQQPPKLTDWNDNDWMEKERIDAATPKTLVLSDLPRDNKYQQNVRKQ